MKGENGSSFDPVVELSSTYKYHTRKRVAGIQSSRLPQISIDSQTRSHVDELPRDIKRSKQQTYFAQCQDDKPRRRLGFIKKCDNIASWLMNYDAIIAQARDTKLSMTLNALKGQGIQT
ncbi:hypothetical protein JOM56_009657 [Amanita muscaria]